MTELLDGHGVGEVRAGAGGDPAAVRLGGGWRPVTHTLNRWVVDTDWWRTPVRREYRRCLVDGGRVPRALPRARLPGLAGGAPL